jgi:hypothetical protein
MTRILTFLEYILSLLTELLMQQIVSHLLVSTQTGFSFFGHQLFPHKNMRKCRDIRCGIEDYRIAQMTPFARQLIMLLEWMN